MAGQEIQMNRNGILPWGEEFLQLLGSYFSEYTSTEEDKNQQSAKYAGQYNRVKTQSVPITEW